MLLSLFSVSAEELYGVARSVTFTAVVCSGITFLSVATNWFMLPAVTLPVSPFTITGTMWMLNAATARTSSAFCSPDDG